MNYTIKITPIANADVEIAADYIAYLKKDLQAAANLVTTIKNKLNTLTTYPKQHAILDAPILRAYDIRFMVIDNYLAFYNVDDNLALVKIIRILPAKSNWMNTLNQSIENYYDNYSSDKGFIHESSEPYKEK